MIVQKAAYEYESLKPLIFSIMDGLGGEAIAGCRRVLLKPNLLTTAKPADAIVTHCLVVRAVAEYVLSKGALPLIADSPGMGSFQKILKESGLKDALQGLPAECREFRESLPTDIGAPFGVIDLAREAVEAELTINLPKLKTHSQMLLTLGVKNMFGCVAGLRKPEWHMKAGVNRELFARLLVQICRRLKPQMTILDGILSMEGEGPGKGGKPRPLGVIIAGRDPFAVDAVVCSLLGLQPDMLPTLKVARELGLLEENPEIEGALPEVRDFQLPTLSGLVFGPPALHGFMRRYLLQRPVCDAEQCRMCGQCWEFCPAGALSPGKEAVSFAYERCIRCYCCLEVCPEGALHTVEPLAGRLLRRWIG